MSSTGLERLCSDNGEIVSVISEMEDISIGARRYGHFIGRDLTIEKIGDMWQILYLSVGALAQWSV